MSQYQTASHGKEGSTIRSSVWCLSPYSRLHFLHEVLCVKRVDCPFLGVSWNARLRNHTHHHIPPLAGTELVVSQPPEQGDSQQSACFHHQVSLKETTQFSKEKKAPATCCSPP